MDSQRHLRSAGRVRLRLDRARATTPEAEERIRRCNERAEFAQRKRDTLVQRSTIRRVRASRRAPRARPDVMSSERNPSVLTCKQTRGTPVLKRLPYFKVYRNRQDEVYNMLCTQHAPQAVPVKGVHVP